MTQNEYLLNHFISVLGELGVSYLALLFNLGLILVDIAYIFFPINLLFQYMISALMFFYGGMLFLQL